VSAVSEDEVERLRSHEDAEREVLGVHTAGRPAGLERQNNGRPSPEFAVCSCNFETAGFYDDLYRHPPAEMWDPNQSRMGAPGVYGVVVARIVLGTISTHV
jgi:hypothetical protein